MDWYQILIGVTVFITAIYLGIKIKIKTNTIMIVGRIEINNFRIEKVG